MIFLGQASNYTRRQAWRHLLARGKTADREALQAQLAKKYHSTPERVRLYHTGRSALAAGIQSVVPLGKPVIIPGLTCIAVVRAVRAAGCEPVFCDIDAQTLQYDWPKLEQVLAKIFRGQSQGSINSIDNNGKVCYNGGIVAQNTLGLPLEMGRLEQLAQRYHLAIIEDLAHSAGRPYPDGREAGTVGAVTVLSFGKDKAIDTIEGGALVVREPAAPLPEVPTRQPRWQDRWRDRWYPVLGRWMRAATRIGMGKLVTGGFIKLGWIARSGDAELDTAVGLTNWQAKLAREQLQNLPTTPLREHAFVTERAAFLRAARQRGFYLDALWYDAPVGPARCYKEANFPANECPVTVRVAAEIINLPIWYDKKRLAPVREFLRQWQTEHPAEAKHE